MDRVSAWSPPPETLTYVTDTRGRRKLALTEQLPASCSPHPTLLSFWIVRLFGVTSVSKDDNSTGIVSLLHRKSTTQCERSLHHLIVSFPPTPCPLPDPLVPK